MELPIRLSKESRVPIYHQIEGQIKALIASGVLPAGSPLPSIRSLSKDLEVSVITTRRAYQDLEYKGFITTIQGKGTFVAEVAESEKADVKHSSVYQALENGIRTAMSYDCTLEEIEEIFHKVVEKIKNGEE
ncbi:MULTISPECIES: GntR family transcriptional regulator [Bacillaceae]|uniref:Transcriptional regulator n=1 Tax=Bacillus infantis NRRL B-14911 TaxID=1367477 RepID=U5LHJ8_9BACI|nr:MULTISPECIES: GntR family transcriptional regulator [Bacillus]OXT16980.1 GntR family transcriptional regulator [Bacillus sp. OG2]AGX06141.1 transcriptional regulator [Bacillus infantis NRRL B-14911]EAR65618.1 transcriptional regulator (GntR family) protein [Bacillus sp. NRRL B-14911]MCK6207811.1 GntR family transcriptional regulator [Bacillus infantis]MCP1160378.1 GntR family transcriptional regulator [Bacillus infantis]